MLLVLLVAAVMISAGGLATASNTGFKINKALQPAGAGQIGNTWLSLPYFNPYPNWAAFCSATGLISTGLTGRATIQFQDPQGTGALTSPVQCGTAAASTTPLNPPVVNGVAYPGLGFQVRNGGTGAPASIIIVGSHNPTLSFSVYPVAAASQKGSNWFAVPYHTTAVSANDLCLSSGLTSTGLQKASILRFDPVTGGVVGPVVCGSSAAQSLILQLGEAVRIREATTVTTVKTFIPAHF
jgi:hypothetical protein